MSNLAAIVLPLVLVWSGAGYSPATIARQPHPQLVDAFTNCYGDTAAIHSRLLVAKKCPLKRYRRPH